MNKSDNVHKNVPENSEKKKKKKFKILSQKFFIGNVLLLLLLTEQLHRWIVAKTEFMQCIYGTKR